MPVETEEITGLLDKIIARYKPGGEFGKAELALLERAKTKSLATTAQSLVSAGLAGTTVGVGAGRKWEEEIGMPSRLRLEDIRTERLTQAMGAKAGYIERAATREEQAALAREQMELEEKFRNKQISLQEYLATSDRLKARGGGGGRQPQAGIGGLAAQYRDEGVDTKTETGGFGGDFGGAGGGYGGVDRPAPPPLVGGQRTFQHAMYEARHGYIQPRQLADMAQKWLGEPTETWGTQKQIEGARNPFAPLT